ncbi:SipW-dependent-type signal peptide-containing protein [Microbacterium sp. G2-8]|uniref:SipW-dependent-type signal peptide-containing protein n=1 Tax=Microbacterium sp. G2-8 TaxID=2842454 RepID=UPI001C89F179|nr:SipW-dependent-type signal peptide-containing protein [Microbacterium sp. G2-8]
MATTTTRRKILAVLAGGTVVGVGAAITLANWNDSEFATGTFAAGSFNIEGSLDNGGTDAYAEHDTAATAQQLDTVEYVADTSSMVPGEIAYDSFFVRVDAPTTVSGTLAMNGITGTGDVAEYAYDVAAIGVGETCDATTIAAGTVLGTGAGLDENTAAAATADLVHDDDTAVAGVPVHLCFAVEASEELTQGATATATWEFQATSDDAS